MGLRDAIGPALVELGCTSDFVVLDADNAPATRVSEFAEAFPDRYINVGCAEQNMIGVAAGVMSFGVPVVVSTFSAFLCGRAFDQIRCTLSKIPGTSILLGTHYGVSVGRDGPSHFCAEDIALMGSIAGIRILSISRNTQVKSILNRALLEGGCTYIRVSRHSGTYLPSSRETENVEVHLVREGADALILCTGILLDRAVAAADLLAKSGRNTAVCDVIQIEPLPAQVKMFISAYRRIIIVEEHVRYGGLASRVLEATCGRQRPVEVIVQNVCVDMSKAHSGGPDEVLDLCGCSTGDIAEAIDRCFTSR